MEQIKKIIKKQIILVILLGIIGLIFRNKYILLGLSLGSLVSLGGFLILCYEGKVDLHYGNKSIISGVRRYLKRMLLYGIYLFIMIKYFGQEMLFAGVIGIMTIKANILFDVALEWITKFYNSKFRK
ncbi:ATP synthase subunit I [Fusobacterium sp. PH5-44]|uniref:ATP synthase subunit I n=2 Tax=unclassified Fusobacterium TaxID=2648384 RepID=UPI003D24ED19